MEANEDVHGDNTEAGDSNNPNMYVSWFSCEYIPYLILAKYYTKSLYLSTYVNKNYSKKASDFKWNVRFKTSIA